MEDLTSLIERVRGGDRDAYGRLVGRFQDMAVGYAFSLLGDFHLAEDAAQEAFLLVYLDLADLKEPAAFPGWFRRIIHSQCGRQRRRARGQSVALDDVGGIASDRGDPARKFEESDAQDRLLQAMATLPELDRAIVALFYISRLNHNEIAAFLDVPPSRINNRLYSSRKRLREELIRMTAEKRPSGDDEFVARIEARVHALEALHAGLADGLVEVLRKPLEEDAQVQVRRVATTTFGEYLKALPSPSLTLHYLVEPIGGRIVFDLTPDLAYAVAEKALATGKSSWAEIEKGMREEDWSELHSFGHEVQDLLERIWKPVVGLKLADAMWESNLVGLMAHPRFGEFAFDEKLAELHEAPDQPSVQLDLTATVGDVVCRPSLCYPSTVLEGVLPHLSK